MRAIFQTIHTKFQVWWYRHKYHQIKELTVDGVVVHLCALPISSLVISGHIFVNIRKVNEHSVKYSLSEEFRKHIIMHLRTTGKQTNK